VYLSPELAVSTIAALFSAWQVYLNRQSLIKKSPKNA
jgi:hypothetical protein